MLYVVQTKHPLLMLEIQIGESRTESKSSGGWVVCGRPYCNYFLFSYVIFVIKSYSANSVRCFWTLAVWSSDFLHHPLFMGGRKTNLLRHLSLPQILSQLTKILLKFDNIFTKFQKSLAPFSDFLKCWFHNNSASFNLIIQVMIRILASVARVVYRLCWLTFSSNFRIGPGGAPNPPAPRGTSPAQRSLRENGN